MKTNKFKFGALLSGLLTIVVVLLFQNCAVRRLEDASLGSVSQVPSGLLTPTPIASKGVCFGEMPTDLRIDGGIQGLEFRSIYAIVNRVGNTTSLSLNLSTSCLDPQMAVGGSQNCPKSGGACIPEGSASVILDLVCANNLTATSCTLYPQGYTVDFNRIKSTTSPQGLFGEPDFVRVLPMYTQNFNICSSNGIENFMTVMMRRDDLSGTIRILNLTSLNPGSTVEFEFRDVAVMTSSRKKVTLNGTLKASIIQLTTCN